MASYRSDSLAQKTLRALFIIAVATSVIPNGSVGDYGYYASTMFHGLIFTFAALISFRTSTVSKLYKTTIVIVVISMAYVLAQIVSFPGNPFANPAWEMVAEFTERHYETISVAPWVTLSTLPGLIIPFLVFANALILFQTDTLSRALWRRLALLGGALALISLVRHQIFPESALFGTPSRGQENLTGNFYNRNNSAAFFALASLAMLGLILMQLTKIRWKSIQRRLHKFQFFDDRKYTVLAVYMVLFFICIITVFLTRSRGGVGFMMVSLTGAAVIIAMVSNRTSKIKLAARLGISAGLLIVSVLVFGIYGARTIRRVELGGFDDARWCIAKSTYRAILDYPIFGTGFGTYRDIFPIYRDLECGIYGIWDRAHNSFLEAYLGLGFPFALLLVASLLAVLAALRVGYKERHRFRFIPVLTLFALVYMMLHSFWDFPIQIHGIAVYFAALLGAGCGISLARSSVKQPV